MGVSAHSPALLQTKTLLASTPILTARFPIIRNRRGDRSAGPSGGFITMSGTLAAAIIEDIHVWEAGGAGSAEALSAWVASRLAAHEAALAALLAVEGPRTPEN